MDVDEGYRLYDIVYMLVMDYGKIGASIVVYINERCQVTVQQIKTFPALLFP